MTETTTMKTIITPDAIREEAGVSKIVEGGMTMKPSITIQERDRSHISMTNLLSRKIEPMKKLSLIHIYYILCIF